MGALAEGVLYVPTVHLEPIFRGSDLVAHMQAAVWRTHAGIIVGRNLALLGADPNCAVCTLSRAGPPVDSPTFYGWPHAFAIAGANHDDQIGFLPVGENVKAAPFQQRLLNALARYGVGIGLVQRLSRVGINHNAHGPGLQ